MRRLDDSRCCWGPRAGGNHPPPARGMISLGSHSHPLLGSQDVRVQRCHSAGEILLHEDPSEDAQDGCLSPHRPIHFPTGYVPEEGRLHHHKKENVGDRKDGIEGEEVLCGGVLDWCWWWHVAVVCVCVVVFSDTRLAKTAVTLISASWPTFFRAS